MSAPLAILFATQLGLSSAACSTDADPSTGSTVTAARLRGRIVVAGASTLPPFTVSLLGTTATTTTLADGSYELRDVPAGRYAVAVEVPSTRELSRTVVVDVGRDGAAVAPDILFQGLGTVTGRVRLASGEPSADTLVFASTNDVVTTDGQGRFTLRAAAGPTRLSAFRSGFGGNSVQVDVPYALETTSADLVLESVRTDTRPKVTVDGLVHLLGEDGDDGVTVIVLGTTVQSLTSAAGSYRLEGVPYGKQTLRFVKGPYEEEATVLALGTEGTFLVDGDGKAAPLGLLELARGRRLFSEVDVTSMPARNAPAVTFRTENVAVPSCRLLFDDTLRDLGPCGAIVPTPDGRAVWLGADGKLRLTPAVGPDRILDTPGDIPVFETVTNDGVLLSFPTTSRTRRLVSFTGQAWEAGSMNVFPAPWLAAGEFYSWNGNLTRRSLATGTITKVYDGTATGYFGQLLGHDATHMLYVAMPGYPLDASPPQLVSLELATGTKNVLRTGLDSWRPLRGAGLVCFDGKLSHYFPDGRRASLASLGDCAWDAASESDDVLVLHAVGPWPGGYKTAAFVRGAEKLERLSETERFVDVGLAGEWLFWTSGNTLRSRRAGTSEERSLGYNSSLTRFLPSPNGSRMAITALYGQGFLLTDVTTGTTLNSGPRAVGWSSDSKYLLTYGAGLTALVSASSGATVPLVDTSSYGQFAAPTWQDARHAVGPRDAPKLAFQRGTYRLTVP